MKKIYSTPVSTEAKTRLRASILAGSNGGFGTITTPNATSSTNLRDGSIGEFDSSIDELGARARYSLD